MKLATNIFRLLKKLLFPNRRQELPKDKLGNHGEKKAAKFLKSQGYKIIDRNVRFSIGEIDIIAKTEKTLVVVEVKTRLSSKYCHPLEVVDRKKCERIQKMGRQYYRNKKYAAQGFAIRFDIITIIWPDWPKGKQPMIEHFIDAFR